MLFAIGLGIGVVGALGVVQAFVTRHRSLAHRAIHDPLTGLLNRAGLIDLLDETISAGDSDFGLLYLDLDRFKAINDSLGHTAGDELLIVVGRRIADSIPDDCHVARLGGDEFVVLCRSAESTSRVNRIAERIAASIIEPIEITGRLLRVGTSIGLASGPWDSPTAVDVIGFANLALHRAKENGRGRTEEFTAMMRDESIRRSIDERRLRDAIDAGDIVPFFQPEYEFSTGRLIGAEILARWVGPDGTHIHAASMLGLIDDPSTLEKITSSVVNQARPIMRRLDAIGLPAEFRFRVNVPQRCTPRAWRDGQIMSVLVDIDPRRLTIDIHESSRIDDPDAADSALNSLRSSGARVCLEDVIGSRTALGSVSSLPLDELRIDARSLRSSNDFAMARAITGLAKDLGLIVSATGVEDRQTAENLGDLGCDHQQGFLHAHVLTADGLEDEIMRDALKRVPDHLIA